VYPTLDYGSSRKRILRVIVCAAITACLALTPIPSLSAKELVDQTQNVRSTPDEQLLLDLVNKERISNGMAALKADPKLKLMARDYGREMISNRFFAHESPVSGGFYKRFSASDVRSDWQLAGENLAISSTIEGAHSGLMESPDHRANLLEPKYTHIGIGIIKGPCGKVVVQEFAAYPREMQPVAFLQSANEFLLLITGWIASVMPISI
jgi:uncharacterized protein YkwD